MSTSLTADCLTLITMTTIPINHSFDQLTLRSTARYHDMADALAKPPEGISHDHSKAFPSSVSLLFMTSNIVSHADPHSTHRAEQSRYRKPATHIYNAPTIVG